MKDEICKKFATKLQEIRKAKKMSQGQLSVEAECSKSYIGQIEGGQKFPTIKMIAKLSRALGVHMRELFDFDYDISQEL